MAKVAMVEKNLRRARTVDKYAKKRAELKERIKKRWQRSSTWVTKIT